MNSTSDRFWVCWASAGSGERETTKASRPNKATTVLSRMVPSLLKEDLAEVGPVNFHVAGGAILPAGLSQIVEAGGVGTQDTQRG